MSVAVVLGLGFGLGVWLIAAGLAPAPPPLDLALDRIGRTPPRPHLNGADDEATTSAAPANQRLGHQLRKLSPVDRLLGRLAADLRVLGRTPDEQAARLALYGLVGLAWPFLLVAMLVMAGVGVPVVVPVWIGFATAVGAVVLGVRQVREDATEAREQYRRAISAYCDVLVLSLAAGMELESALFDAASRGTGPAFDELAQALDQAYLEGRPPWVALGDLGEELGLAELAEVGSTLNLAALEGASVTDTLAMKASSLRERLVAEAEAGTAAATEQMDIPAALVLLGFVALLGFPALALMFEM